MDRVPDWILWFAFAAGLLGGITGGVTLMRRRATPSWPNRGVRWKALGWSQLLIGASFVLMATPRLADAPTHLVYGSSVASVLLLLAGMVVRAIGEARRPLP